MTTETAGQDQEHGGAQVATAVVGTASPNAMLRRRLKAPAYRASALYWLVRTRGRIRGRAFRIRRPRRLVISGAGRVTIGDGTRIDSGSTIVATARCTIGSDSYFGRDLVLVAFDTVEVGAHVLVGERVSVHTENHGPPGRRADYSVAPIRIADDVWIGANVVVTPGVVIGPGATVGANAVVTYDVPGHSVAVGVPAVARPAADG
jgi:maltose O-acetyltransferase